MKYIMDIEAWIDFKKEGAELITNFKTNLLTLETKATEKAINNTFQNIQSLKTLYSKLEIKEIISFISELEYILEKVKKKSIELSPKMLSLLLDSQAILQNYHEIIKENHRSKSSNLEFGINKQTLLSYCDKIKNFNDSKYIISENIKNEDNSHPHKYGIKIILANNIDMPAVRSLIAYNQIESECEILYCDENITNIKMGIPIRQITFFYIEIETNQLNNIKNKILSCTGISSIQIEPLTAPTKTTQKDLKILIADDEENIRLQYEMIFKKHNYKNIFLATNGVEALESFKENMPDIVITDIEMPEMTGIDLIEGIMSYNRDVEIIIVTGKLNANVAIYSAKGITVLPKPIVPMYIFLAVLAAENNLRKTKRINSFIRLMEDQL